MTEISDAGYDVPRRTDVRFLFCLLPLLAALACGSGEKGRSARDLPGPDRELAFELGQPILEVDSYNQGRTVTLRQEVRVTGDKPSHPVLIVIEAPDSTGQRSARLEVANGPIDTLYASGVGGSCRRHDPPTCRITVRAYLPLWEPADTARDGVPAVFVLGEARSRVDTFPYR